MRGMPSYPEHAGDMLMDIAAQIREDTERRERCARLGAVIARDFNPDQPRDPDGKFASGGWGSAKEMTSIPGAIDIYKMRPAEMPMTGEQISHLKEQGKFKTQDVAIDKLIPTQTKLDPETVEKYKQDKPSEREPVNVVKSGGKFYLYDGHHRVAAAAANGEIKVQAHVFTAKGDQRALCPACDSGDCVRHQLSIAQLGGEKMALRGWISWPIFEARFSEDQPRDPDGKFASGSGVSVSVATTGDKLHDRVIVTAKGSARLPEAVLKTFSSEEQEKLREDVGRFEAVNLVKIVFDDGGELFGTREVGGGSLPDAYAAAAARQTHLSETQRAALLQRLQADAAAPIVRPTPPVELDVPESTQTIIVRKAKG